LDDEYKQLVHDEKSPNGITGKKAYSETNFRDHPLADTLWKLREQLLQVNHGKTPCLKPNQLTTQIDFQVIDKLDAKGDIKFLVVNVGGEAAHTDDRTQSLVVTFDMADRSTSLLK
jgi:hypothetical protein